MFRGRYKGKPICYGLGNFCFDAADFRNNGIWERGFLANLCFDEEHVSLTIIPYSQCGAEANVKLMENNVFDHVLSELNSIIGDDCKLTKAFQDLVVTKQRKLLSVMNVFGNAIFDGLFKKGYLGCLCRQERLLVVKDLLYCESHLDVLRCSAANLLNEGE